MRLDTFLLYSLLIPQCVGGVGGDGGVTWRKKLTWCRVCLSQIRQLTEGVEIIMS